MYSFSVGFPLFALIFFFFFSLSLFLQRWGEEYQCSDELKNVCTKRLKFDDIFVILEITANEVGKYVSSVGSKNTSCCDGISNKIIMVSLPYIVQH